MNAPPTVDRRLPGRIHAVLTLAVRGAITRQEALDMTATLVDEHHLARDGAALLAELNRRRDD